MKPHIPPKAGIRQVGFLALFTWAIVCYTSYQTTTTLADLTKLTAILNIARAEISHSRANPYVVAFYLKDTTERPGVFFGSAHEAAENFAARFHTGDTLTFYYNASGITANGANLHTYQVQRGNEIIYPLSEALGLQRFRMKGSLILAAFTTSLVILLILLRKWRIARRQIARRQKTLHEGSTSS